MNNTPEGINSGVSEAEEQINDLEHRMVEITATEQNIEKRKKWRQPKRPRDNIKHTNIDIIGGPRRRRERERT